MEKFPSRENFQVGKFLPRNEDISFEKRICFIQEKINFLLEENSSKKSTICKCKSREITGWKKVVGAPYRNDK